MDSYEIAKEWVAALQDSPALQDFCRDTLGGEPVLILGFDPRAPHGSGDAPYIAVVPFADRDGFERSTARRTVLMAIGLHCRERDELANGYEVRGYGLIRRFESLALDALEGCEAAPSSWEGETSRPGKHLFERHLIFEVVEDNTI